MKLCTRQVLQWTLDRAEDVCAWIHWGWGCFHLIALKRRLGLRYWRMGK